MSVDTYLKRKDTSSYLRVHHQDIEILVSPRLANMVEGLHLDLGRFFLWKTLRVSADARLEHVHTASCRH